MFFFERIASAKSDLGTLALISNASALVQLVIFILIIFSVFSWAIMLFKWRVFKKGFALCDEFLDIFWSGKSMDFIYSEVKKIPNSPLSKVFLAGYIELQRFLEKQTKGSDNKEQPNISNINPLNGLIPNVERALSKAARSEATRLEKSLPFLATAGSTAPFIGLFGTVWGIMNSFQSIGEKGAASLAIVAPGIAEALIATAIGLFCAIPAVIGYNYFLNKLRLIKTQIENFSSDFLNIVRRNISI